MVVFNIYSNYIDKEKFRMIEKLIYKFVDNIGEFNNFDDTQLEQAKYTFKILIYEVTKLAILTIIFALFGYFREIITILFIMSVTKPFIGGYHEDTQLKCFIATLLISIGIIFLMKYSNLSLLSLITLNLLIIFSVYNKAPIINDKMPITKDELIIKNRKLGISAVILFSISSIILFKISWLSQLIVWTLLVQTILMFNRYTPKGGEINENQKITR